jgi:hypothetical protein
LQLGLSALAGHPRHGKGRDRLVSGS